MAVSIVRELSVREQVARAIAQVLSSSGLESHMSAWTPVEQAARAAVLRSGGDYVRAREAAWNARVVRAADRVLAALAGAGPLHLADVVSSDLTDRIADEHVIVDHHHDPHCSACGAKPDRIGEEYGHWIRRHVAEATAAGLARPVALRAAS